VRRLRRPPGERVPDWWSRMRSARPTMAGSRVRGHGGALRTDRVRGGDDGDVMSGERALRRVAQAEHGEAVIARDDSER
jgi:hypothetical protein